MYELKIINNWKRRREIRRMIDQCMSNARVIGAMLFVFSIAGMMPYKSI